MRRRGTSWGSSSHRIGSQSLTATLRTSSHRPGSWRSEIETITAISVANSFFAHGVDEVVAWLLSLRDTFPDSALILGDYYGQIGRRMPP